MGKQSVQPAAVTAWGLAARQHGMVTRGQLAALGYSAKAIKHRVATGRLHRVHAGVYAVGRPQLTLHGRWMAAVLACGHGAALSHRAASALWQILPAATGSIAVSVPAERRPRRPGIVVHRRARLTCEDVAECQGIPVTNPILTLIDLAAELSAPSLDAAVNEADQRGLTDPESLRAAVERLPRYPGSGRLRELLDSHTYVLTESALERRLVPLARRAGLGRPLTGASVNGFKVDFYWPDLGLIVETDGLRYHRTPAQQAQDRLRDQIHAAAGLTTLRFTHPHVAFEADRVASTLRVVADRLRRERRNG